MILHCVSVSNQLQQWTNFCTNFSPKKWGEWGTRPPVKKSGGASSPASPPHYRRSLLSICIVTLSLREPASGFILSATSQSCTSSRRCDQHALSRQSRHPSFLLAPDLELARSTDPFYQETIIIILCNRTQSKVKIKASIV